MDYIICIRFMGVHLSLTYVRCVILFLFKVMSANRILYLSLLNPLYIPELVNQYSPRTPLSKYPLFSRNAHFRTIFNISPVGSVSVIVLWWWATRCCTLTLNP